MADETELQAAGAGAPDSAAEAEQSTSTLEEPTTADVTAWAKEQGAQLEAEQQAESEQQSPAQEGTAPRLSRKERDEQRRAEIRTEERARVENEFRTAQQAEFQQQQAAPVDVLLARIGAEHNRAIVDLGLADEDALAARSAPTMSGALRAVYDAGRRPLESKIATLEAENTSLKGQLAARGPSPLSANGSSGHGAPRVGTDMKSIAQQVAAELGLAF